MKKTCKDDTKNKTPFQQRLIELRGKKRQKDVAKDLGVSRDCIVQWENDNTRQPALDKLILLADYYHVSLDYLLGRSCCRSVDNEYIHQVTGLSDGSINQLKKLVQRDDFLEQANEKNAKRTDNLSVRPVHIAPLLKTINYVLESRLATNLLTFLAYYLDSDKYTTLLDGTFRPLPSKDLYPANKDLVAGGIMIPIDSVTNKALAKNLLQEQLAKLAQEYSKRFSADS